MTDIKAIVSAMFWLVALGLIAADWNGFSSAIKRIADSWFDGLQVLQRRDLG